MRTAFALTGPSPDHLKTEETTPNVGAGLLAKASCQTTLMSTDTTPSRASPLPQETVIRI
ncbi:hypothetical protein EYC95_27855 [Pseudomonas sp. BGI-2]|nr:hypothetical protein EYC95_27855 [Pseudomonas sp. BGI-2]